MTNSQEEIAKIIQSTTSSLLSSSSDDGGGGGLRFDIDDVIAVLKIEVDRLIGIAATSDKKKKTSTTTTTSTSSSDQLQIIASAKYDPGLRDLSGIHEERMKEFGKEKMINLDILPNDCGLVTSKFDDHPAAKTLFKISGEYKLDHYKRNVVLLVEDMQIGYKEWIDYVIPNCKKLVDIFREKSLPIVWTNWSRRPNDKMYCAIDRFYGPKGIYGDTNGNVNPCYIYGSNDNQCVPELAPITDDECSCCIQSYHLSKFADRDIWGNEILFPLFESWGINTVILVGAWTDDCIACTSFEGIDRYGYDIVIINDGVATATTNGNSMLQCLQGACTVSYTADEVCDYIQKNPNNIDIPKAPLRGDVRYTHYYNNNKRGGGK